MKIFFSGNTLALVESRSGIGVQSTHPGCQRIPKVARKEYFQSEMDARGDSVGCAVSSHTKMSKKNELESLRKTEPSGQT